MSATKADLATKVLQRLQVIDADEVAANADHQFVEDTYDDVHELLTEQGHVTWNLASNIPTGAVQPMTAILAYECAQEFGISGAELQSYQIRANEGLLSLRRLGRGYTEPSSVPIEAY